jgi:hypothetical protein
MKNVLLTNNHPKLHKATIKNIMTSLPSTLMSAAFALVHAVSHTCCALFNLIRRSFYRLAAEGKTHSVSVPLRRQNRGHRLFR